MVNPEIFNKANYNEIKLAKIINNFTNEKLGFEFKTQQNKYGVDCILQNRTNNSILLLVEIESCQKAFIKKTKKGYRQVWFNDGCISIPVRRQQSQADFYIRISDIPDLNSDFITESSLAYVNKIKNIKNLPDRTVHSNDYNLENYPDGKEPFICDKLNLDISGKLGTILECFDYIQTKKKIFFLKEGILPPKKKELKFKTFDTFFTN